MNIDPAATAANTDTALPADAPAEAPSAKEPAAVAEDKAAALPPPSGREVPELAGFDTAIQKLLVDEEIPGATLAIGRGGKLLFARGYGWADRPASTHMAANARFRLASISKPITAHAVLRLANRGLFKLDDFVTQHLPEEFAFAISAVEDERWFLVTIRQVLQHTGGWDRDGTDFDPMFESAEIASAFDEESPASLSAIIRYMFRRPLDFQPGSRYAYSNFGYCLLGRVLEQVTGRSYADVVNTELWEPLGLSAEFALGRSLERDRLPREVRYAPSDDSLEPGVFPKDTALPDSALPEAAEHMVPPPYGGFCVETMDAHGGWVGSAAGLVLWSMSLEPPIRGWLRAETWIDAFKRPAAPVSLTPEGLPEPVYYGLGWQVRPTDDRGGFHRWHAGSLPGCSTLLMKRDDDIHIAVLFNRRHEDRLKTPARIIEPELHQLASAIERWPDHDLSAELIAT